MDRIRAVSLSVILAGLLGGAGCGGTPSNPPQVTRTHSSSTSTGTRRTAPPRRPAPPAYPQLLGAARASSPTDFVPAMRWGGRTVAWIARSPAGVALLSFDQHLLSLTLHSGTIDAGTAGWRYGPSISGHERRSLVSAFNGGFRLDTGAGGFMSYGRTAVPLRDGLGSIVVYADGRAEIGAWHQGVPAPGEDVVSVRQNLMLLIDHGVPAPTLGCLSCWGATLGGVSDPARSALGITADGHLMWAGGEHLTASGLAAALVRARVVRAVELDINPAWVAAYLYDHRGGRGLVAVPVVPGQNGVAGQFLAPYSRDFFAISVRRPDRRAG